MTEPVLIVMDMEHFDPELIGLIPSFLDLDDPRPAAEQFNERYHYGGWKHQEGFRKTERAYVLQYPGDPPLRPIVAMPFRDEMVLVYPHAYVAIFQKNGTFECCRMD